MNTFYLIGLAIAGIVLLKKKPGNTVITMDPIDVKPIPYSPVKKPVDIGYINPGIPSGTGTATKLDAGFYNSKPSSPPPKGTEWRYVNGMFARNSGWTAVLIISPDLPWKQNSSNAFFDSKLQGLNEYTE